MSCAAEATNICALNSNLDGPPGQIQSPFLTAAIDNDRIVACEVVRAFANAGYSLNFSPEP